jgi:annexin A7/11
MGTNEEVFNRIFSLESYAQLRLVFEEYQKLTNHPIEMAIESEMSGSVKRAYLTTSKWL